MIMVCGNQCVFSSYAQSYKDKSPKPEPREEASEWMFREYPQWHRGRLQDFTYPTTTTPPCNAAGTIVDGEVDNHAKSNETSIAFW